MALTKRPRYAFDEKSADQPTDRFTRIDKSSSSARYTWLFAFVATPIIYRWRASAL
jgi:hypothetical protein